MCWMPPFAREAFDSVQWFQLSRGFAAPHRPPGELPALEIVPSRIGSGLVPRISDSSAANCRRRPGRQWRPPRRTSEIIADPASDSERLYHSRPHENGLEVMQRGSRGQVRDLHGQVPAAPAIL